MAVLLVRTLKGARRGISLLGSSSSCSSSLLQKAKSASAFSRQTRDFPPMTTIAPGPTPAVRAAFSTQSTSSKPCNEDTATDSAAAPAPPRPRDGPRGSLFDNKQQHQQQHSSSSPPVGPVCVVGQSANIERTFSPDSNAQAMLTCGGPLLAAHASFDPNYRRARTWIHNHAVGPSILSPILVSGLVGALTEAAFPHAIAIQHSLRMTDQPLIVGMTVRAEITVASVSRSTRSDLYMTTTTTNKQTDPPSLSSSSSSRQMGFRVKLDTSVVRVQDDAAIAKGDQVIWIPDYLNM